MTWYRAGASRAEVGKLERMPESVWDPEELQTVHATTTLMISCRTAPRTRGPAVRGEAGFVSEGLVETNEETYLVP